MAITGGSVTAASIMRNSGSFVTFTSGTLALTGGMGVGVAGPLGSAVVLNNGATLTVGTALNIDAGGSLTVNPGGVAQVGDAIVVGNSGSGSLSVLGGAVHSYWGGIGKTATGTGTVVVSGVGSAWNSDNTLVVGSSGTGSVSVTSGGHLSTAYAYLGGFLSHETGNGSVSVSGADSVVNASSLIVGKSGQGSLDISAGGQVTSVAGSIGDEGSGTGTVTVSDGASWINTGYYFVLGRGGSGSLTVSTGGTVSSNFARIGFFDFASDGASNGTGSASVSGAGSTWTNTGSLTMSGSTSSLTIFNAGSMSTGSLVLADSSVSISTLNIGQFSGGTTAGTLDTATVEFGLGTGVINFNQKDTVTFSAVISGSGTVVQRGSGNTILSGNNAYSGGTFVNEGTLRGLSSSAFGTGTITVNGGIFQLDAGVAIANEIKLAGGSFAQAVTAGTDLTNAINTTSDLSGGAPTNAVILAGESSDNTDLAGSFSAFSLAQNDEIRLSDVFHLQGSGSDFIVLQLTVGSLPSDAFLAWLNPGTNAWVNAIDGNTGNNAFAAQQSFSGSFASFQGTYGTDLSAYLGAYGSDAGTGSLWAVINHNSDFAAILEHSTYALLLLGGAVVLFIKRRKTNRVNHGGLGDPSR